jgi:RNA polymerase sigma factor (sigma-70 family)
MDRVIATGQSTSATAGSQPHADETLTSFVIAHYDRLLGLARLICRDTNDAADAVQIGLEQAWRRRDTLRDPDRLRPWLDRIVAREAVRASRQRRTWFRRLVSFEPDVIWLDPADRGSELTPEMTALRQSFAGLPAEQRAVVALHHHLGYSVVETADLVGAPFETVRTRLRRATDRLRRELEESDR